LLWIPSYSPAKIAALVENPGPSAHEANALLEPAKPALEDTVRWIDNVACISVISVIHDRNGQICKVSLITDGVAPAPK
jgi:hypothetical protein